MNLFRLVQCWSHPHCSSHFSIFGNSWKHDGCISVSSTETLTGMGFQCYYNSHITLKKKITQGKEVLLDLIVLHSVSAKDLTSTTLLPWSIYLTDDSLPIPSDSCCSSQCKKEALSLHSSYCLHSTSYQHHNTFLPVSAMAIPFRNQKPKKKTHAFSLHFCFRKDYIYIL